jgi:hypothetical protein
MCLVPFLKTFWQLSVQLRAPYTFYALVYLFHIRAKAELGENPQVPTLALFGIVQVLPPSSSSSLFSLCSHSSRLILMSPSPLIRCLVHLAPCPLVSSATPSLLHHPLVVPRLPHLVLSPLPLSRPMPSVKQQLCRRMGISWYMLSSIAYRLILSCIPRLVSCHVVARSVMLATTSLNSIKEPGRAGQG